MTTQFYIQVMLGETRCQYHCQLIGRHFHVSGKNKSILMDEDGQLVAGEMRQEFLQPIYEAIQAYLRPPDSAIIVPITPFLSGDDGTQ